MKKLLSVILIATMIFSFSSCGVKRIERDEQGNVIKDAPKQKTYAEMSFDEKLEYMSNKELVPTDIKKDLGVVAPVCYKGSPEYGYINNVGDWFIAPQYTHAYAYKEGFAPIIDKYEDYEYLTDQGELFQTNLSKKTTIKAAKHFSEGYAAFVLDTGYEQTKLYQSKDGVTQISATDLPTVKGLKYDNKLYFAVATPFHNGLAVVMRKTNASIIEKYGLEKAQKNNLFESAYVINTSGEIVNTLPAGYDVNDYGYNDNGTVIVRDMTKGGQNYGVLGVDGTEFIPCIYHTVEYGEDDLFLVQNSNGFYGYITKTGIVRVEFKYIAAYAFSNGYAAVKNESLWGIIDTSGKFVVEPKYNNIAKIFYPDTDVNLGGGAVMENVFAAQYNDYWMLGNIDGSIVHATYAPGANESPYYNASCDKFIAYREYVNGNPTGMVGVLDVNGALVLPFDFTDVGCFSK